ncbi:hypothetical protein GIB67_019790 [Kingdonia uniflora]|uniref:non-specific serine/threonine protein kinase n=1 Tax=Kingdonia uniflora TaxID=39325 RepID=A0A7J7MKD4_9MAGN|nr:hypothetical protein GIB67_019790 [Kingdonia uniflora]
MLENTLLDGSTAPHLKIYDFRYSKSSMLHSQPKSIVGTPTYIAPEVLSKNEYNRKVADVWSCRVTLYVILVGIYRFEDPEDPRNFRMMVGRLTMSEIKNHSWFLKNLPIDLMDDVNDSFQSNDIINPYQSFEDIFAIVREAGKLVEGATFGGNIIGGNMDLDDLDNDVDLDDVEASGDFVCAL